MRTDHEVNRVKMDARDWRITCIECGQDFESTRSDASFCSSTCRSKFTRRKKNRTIEIDRLKQQLEKVLANMPRNGNSPEFDALNWLIRRVSKAVNNVESK